MTLGFMARFEAPILSGEKIHTIREDKKDRWTSGRAIHFVVGNRTKARRQFKRDVCTSIQEIEIYNLAFSSELGIKIDGVLVLGILPVLAKNDGLTVQEFKDHFNKPQFPYFKGKIIHWTNTPNIYK